MKKAKTKATSIRNFLIVVVILLIGLSGVGFYFTFGWLETYAKDVNDAVSQSGTGGSTVQSLQDLQENLNSHQDVIAATDGLYASTLDYQLQIVKDIKKYATDAGITISDFSFPADASPTIGSPTKQVSAKLASPASYTKLLKFISAIQGSTPKMQVSSINLGRDNTGGSDSVTTDTLTIEVYTK